MLHPGIRTLAISLFLLTGAGTGASIHSSDELEAVSLPQLETYLSDIDSQLEKLAHYSPRGGFGRVGYRSAEFTGPDQSTACRVILAEKETVDQVVLVPTIIRDPTKGFRPDGFPQALRILDEHGTVLAERSFDDEHLKSIAPRLIPLAGKPVSALVVEATRLSPRAFDGKHVFQLAELLVFNRAENIALGRPVEPSIPPLNDAAAWSPRFATDGSLPYLMNSAQGKPSLAYMSPRIGARIELLPLRLTIDLGVSLPLSQLNLHTVDQSDTIPQSLPDGTGLPRHLWVEGSNRPDFSDARTLLETRCETAFDSDPVMMWPLFGNPVRYVRLTAVEPDLYPFQDGLHPRIGFAEIELLSEGRNVAAGKVFQVPAEQRDQRRPGANLSDQRNIFGRILPTRQWMEELALRHELETLRPRIVHELTLRYARQKTMLRGLTWLAAALVAGIGFILLADRLVRMRQIARLKERFAADLHDELGANLHTIGLLSELIQRKAGPLPDDASTYLERIQAVARQSGIAVQHVTELQAVSGLYGNLEADMQRAADRTLAQVEHRLTVEGGDALNQLPPQKRTDLFLFYKECLINICRHSGASQVHTRLTVKPREVVLSVTDNGRGRPESLVGTPPPSLERRAKLLRARLQVQDPEGGGCRVILTLHLSRRFTLYVRKGS